MPNQDNVTAYSNDAAYRIVPILNDRLRTAASDAGWPVNVVEALSVDYDGDVVFVRVPPQYESHAGSNL